MIRLGCLPLLALAFLPEISAAQSCSSFNTPFSNLQQPKDYYQHVGSNSYHQGVLSLNGSCTYAAQAGTNFCAITCSTSVGGGANDIGSVTTGYKHSSNSSYTQGTAASNGPSVTCGGQMAVAVRSCLVIQPSCDISVTISGSQNGIGGSVSYSASPIWNPTLTYNYSCGTKSSGSSTPCSPVYPAPYLPPDVGAEYVWDYTTCSWVMEPCSEAGCSSPIVIDTDGSGFQMTSAANGVSFDFYGAGTPIQVAWTAKGSKNGWLALPKDGKISSARDLFGNLTPQYLSTAHPANGFAALAIYDEPAQGGNDNGLIDPHDAIWGQLRVWIDENHDGVAQSGELHTLDEIGIKHIDLGYRDSTFVDQYGNQFRYRGTLVPMASDDVDRKIFDVFLKSK